MTFNAPRSPSNPIFSNLGILKVFDLVEVLNILFVHQYFNRGLPNDLIDTLSFSKICHSFNTRGSALGLLQLGERILFISTPYDQKRSSKNFKLKIKKMFSGSSEIAKNEENAFCIQDEEYTTLLIINFSRKKSSFVFDLNA